jgi:prepilin-type N-terminal cleavage/methylation domain-containing protein
MKEYNLMLTSKGFTLLEVLISVAILSFVTLGIISITGDSTTTKDRVIEEDKQNLQIEMAMARLEWDFSQIYSPMYFSGRFEKAFTPPGASTSASSSSFDQVMSRFRANKRFPFPDTEGLPVPEFKVDRSSFTFFTTSNRRKVENSKQSHFAWVKYALEAPRDREDGQEGDNLVRYFLADDPWGEDELDFSEVRAHILMEGVKSLKFFFWDREQRKWSDSLDVIQDGAHLVRGLRVDLVWIDASGLEREERRIFRPLFPYFKAENLKSASKTRF